MKIKNSIERLGIAELSDMQKQVAHEILQEDRDLLVLSPTGTGKTLAYLLPLIELIDEHRQEVQALVLVPGRELALQSATVLRDLGNPVSGCACYGGRTAMEEHRMLRRQKPQVVFATPGRLVDHLEKENISRSTVRYLIIDEFDKCLEMGFADEMSHILNMLPRLQRRILLSATDARESPSYLRLDNMVRMDFLRTNSQPSDRIQTYQIRSIQKDKLQVLSTLLCMLGNIRTIVFLNYRESVVRTYDYLRDLGFHTSMYHGGLDQKERETALYKFSNGSVNVLVCTDLGSRGLDIPDVENIVHYHLPDTSESYRHRIGRTARWDAKGRSFFLLGPDETIPMFVEEEILSFELSEENYGVPVPVMATLYIGKGKKDKISKGDILGFLCKKGNLKSGDIGRIDVKERYSYVAVQRNKLKSLMQLIQHEKLKGIRTVFEEMI